MPNQSDPNLNQPITLTNLPPTVLALKKKFEGKKMIATILGILLLVLGIGAGLVLVGQQQNFKNKAGFWVTDPMGGEGSDKWLPDQEALDSWRAQLDDEDTRAKEYDAEQEEEKQQACGGQPSGCKCGTYVGGDGCIRCNDGCTSEQINSYYDEPVKKQLSQIKCSDTGKEDAWGCTAGCCSTAHPNGGIPNAKMTVSYNTTDGKTVTHTTTNVADALLAVGLYQCKAGESCTKDTYINTPNLSAQRTITLSKDKGGTDCGKWGIVDGINVFENPLCKTLSGGAIYIGTTNGGNPCMPAAGYDACTDKNRESVKCSIYGLSKCNCGGVGGVWIVGAGANCNDLCGSTNAICESPACSGGESPASNSQQCTNIKVYDTTWKQLVIADLTNLKAGDIIRLAVVGTATSGTIDQAKFIVNGVERAAVSTKKSGTNEFYDEYTIPAGISSFSIQAKLHHSTGVWF